MSTLSRAGSIFVLLVLALGVWFRVVGLEDKVLWHDEVYTRVFASGFQSEDWQQALFTAEVLPVDEVRRFQRYDPSKGVIDTVRGLAQDEPQHPPIYYVAMRLWMGVFGDSIGTLRGLSALAGIAMVPAMFWFCWELFRNRRSAWMGAVVASSSPFFVLYAQEAREYALWGTLIVLASAGLLRAIRLTEQSASSSWAWGLYAGLVAAALYTSFSTAAVAIAHVAYIVLRERGTFTPAGVRAAGALSLSALLFSPWAWMLWTHFEAFQASMAWSKIIIIPRSELLWTLGLNASRIVVDLWDGFDHVGVSVAVLLCAVLLTWVVGVLIRECEREVWLLVVLLIGVPIGLLLGPDLLWGGIRSVSARYLIPSWIGLQVALTYVVAQEKTYARVLAGLVVGAGLISCVSNGSKTAVWTKGVSVALPEVGELISGADRPLVIGNRERHHPGNLHALANRVDDDTHMQLLWTGHEVDYALPQGFETVFLFSPIPPFVDQLTAGGELEAVLLVDDLHLQLYELVPASSGR
ncbi:MAG: glycosyltransferase family 39 protein [Proteobacteria bacterium]|nr:glycosyltransferase family 39 protein [Pseudomonadota bacterium]